jgi:hypothetical protein
MKNQTINELNYQARRLLLLGVTGTGKTTLACRLVYSHPAPLVLIYDWQGAEFAQRLGATPAESREELAARIESGERLVCYDAESSENEPEGDGFTWFCEMAFEVAGRTPGRKLVVVDECQELIDPWKIPDGLGKLLSRGRRRMVDTCLLGSAANALHSVGRNQVTEAYFFRTTDENALKYPASLGLDTDEIRDLKNTEFVYRNNVTGEKEKLALWDKAA